MAKLALAGKVFGRVLPVRRALYLDIAFFQRPLLRKTFEMDQTQQRVCPIYENGSILFAQGSIRSNVREECVFGTIDHPSRADIRSSGGWKAASAIRSSHLQRQGDFQKHGENFEANG